MTVADRIRQRRCEMELSQADLAKRANYSDKTRISKIENSGNDISMKQIKRIAEALDCSPAFLMGWEDVSEELQRQVKPLTDFLKAHKIDHNNVYDALVERYGEKDVKCAFTFVKAYLDANPERQKIALEILRQSHPDGS